MWYRVFCRAKDELPPAELLRRLRGEGLAVDGRFRGDGLGWTVADLRLGAGTPIFVERYITETDDLRNELNAWAAYLETLDYAPNHSDLMERVIQSNQLVTVRKPLNLSNEVVAEWLCEQICREIASFTDGIYQIDNDGWYSSTGLLLLKEF
jgi:hypothetical protein